jgi:putative membrane protein
MKTRTARLLAGITAITTFAGNAFAQSTEPLPAKSIGHALLNTAIFAAAGMVLVFVAFKVVDWVTPRIDIQKELLNNNIAVAIISAAVIIGVSLIVAVSIM